MQKESFIYAVDKDGREHRIPLGEDRNLARVLFLSGHFEPRILCSGLARCGRCRVRMESPPEPKPIDRKLFSEAELQEGVRAACRHDAVDGMRVHVGPAHTGPLYGYLTESKERVPFAAVDVGTTMIKWAGTDGRNITAQGREPNPQAGAGGEIMSRLAFAEKPGGAETLRTLLLDRLTAIREFLMQKHRPGDRLCITGNSAMIYLLLGKPVGGLARAPYSLEYRGGEELSLGSELPRVYIPPLIGPFIGADLSAGLTALRFGDKPVAYPFLLADMGTNGEFILALDEETYKAVSVPLGPALEGAGLTFGTAAAPGAVTSVSFTPAGLKPLRQEQGPERGITGTGYLSLLARLLSAGVLDRQGRFARGKEASPLLQKLLAQLREEAGETRLYIDEGMYLAPEDVETLLKVKAAFNTAVSSLLKAAGMHYAELTAVYLAGALGEYVNIADLHEAGFLPPTARVLVEPAGNTSLQGGLLFLTRPETREWIQTAAQRVEVLNLTESEDFQRAYIERMVFEHVA